jgi:succinate dehydrogenase/fumarate reductase cytochrome b subunit
MKKSLFVTPLIILSLPQLSFAQDSSLQILFANIPTFIDGVLIPFLFGLAFLIFVINVIRYFVIEGNNEKGRENAKALAIYSVAAFVFLIIFWGIVNMFTSSSGLDDCTQPMGDYEARFFKGPNLPDCK